MLNALGRLLSARFLKHPILIVGTGRSGTSVLLQAMGRHPAIYALSGEAPFLTSMGGSAYLFEDAENRDYYLDSLKVPKAYLYDQLRRLGFEAAAGPHFGLRRSLKGVLGRSPSPLGRRYWCAKSFPSEPVTRGLLALYPTIRFIYIVRNGCEVVQSRTKFKGFTHQGFKQHCLNWAEGVDKYRHLTRIRESCLVSQEALVDDPDALFEKLFRFLAIPEHPGAADYARTTLVHPLDKSTRTGTDARKVLAEREAAHTGWTDEQKSLFKEICGSAMAELRYPVPF
jgi:hypothetical protein